MPISMLLCADVLMVNATIAITAEIKVFIVFLFKE
jgi:hypothetical protein